MKKIIYEGRPFRVINKGGYVFENARGGPYKYGFPVECSREAMRAIIAGEL